MKDRIKINFTDFWHPPTPEAISDNPLHRLLSKRFDLELSDEPDFLIYSCFGKEYLKYNCTRIFYAGENRRPDFSECDYAFSFDYPVSDRNYRLPLFRLYLDDYEQLKYRQENLEQIDHQKRKFCNFLYSNNRARERNRFFRQLQKYKHVDSGGRALNNLGYFIEDKLSFLRNYKFTIAFENTSYPGYTTEKILHAFLANTIPIYWGNPLIEQDFNTRAFINCHDYGSFEEAVKRVIEVDNNDDLYLEYLREPVFKGGSESSCLKEDNILDAFETIFLDSNTTPRARKTDRLKYYAYALYFFCRRCLKAVLAPFRLLIRKIHDH